MLFARLLSVLLVALGAACAQRADFEFRTASSVAIRHSNTVTGSRYERDVLFEAYQRAAVPKLRQCSSQMVVSEQEPVSVIFVLNAAGQVSQVYLDRETDLGRCFERALRALVFPPPPFEGYHQQVRLAPERNES